MKILAIETSCDETAIAVVEAKGEKDNPSFKTLGNAINSQIDIHKEYGGVFPTLAKREHALNIVHVLIETLEKSEILIEEKNNVSEKKKNKIKEILSREEQLFSTFINFLEKYRKSDVDYIAVTEGPGLEPALWVGINFAKALSVAWNIPLVPTNHLEGHITSVLADSDIKTEFPVASLIISGGHTELILAKEWGEYELIGQTRDDAVGEAFDKVARILGLPYPGGPEISRLAKEARDTNLEKDSTYTLPRPMINSKDYDFSFSGLKTAVLYMVKKIPDLTEKIKKQIAREFEDAVTDVLMSKTKEALDEFNPSTLIIGGGVIANNHLRESFEKLTADYSDIKLLIPERHLSTDNAVMIALASYFKILDGTIPKMNSIEANGNLRLAN